MEAFLVSIGLVTLAEIGDKTQLLSFVLAARFRRPGTICVAILLATLVNHGLAGVLANWLVTLFTPTVLKWTLCVVFAAMAVWILIPDKLDEDELETPRRLGVFGTTLVAFFLAEMGDKTQFATVAMVAQYQAFGAVVLGSTLGMMLANVPAVFMGDRLAHRIPLRAVRIAAAIVFVGLAIAAAVSTPAANWS